MESPRSGRRVDTGNGSTQMAIDSAPYPAATTHVLTDEKGHSIKIRIASPPPQRQTQLAKFYEQQKREQENKQQQQNQSKQQPSEHRDSIVSISQFSDSPLMMDGLDRRQSSSTQGDEIFMDVAGGCGRESSLRSPAPKRCRLSPTSRQGGRHRPKWSAANKAASNETSERHHYTGSGGSSSLREEVEVGELEGGDVGERNGSGRRWVEFEEDMRTRGGCEADGEEADFEEEEEEEDDYGKAFEADGSEDSGGSEASRRSKVERKPIEAFNDSNTSEFDDPGWDSRQDTSLDFGGLSGKGGQGNLGQLVGDGQNSQLSNDSVMDADLRQANRINMELLVLQNATQNMMMTGPGGAAHFSASAAATGNPAGNLARNYRSKSITSSAAGFPQCGILQAASESSNQHQHQRHVMASQVDHPYSYPNHNQDQDSQELVSGERKPRACSGDSGVAGSMAADSSRRSSLAQTVAPPSIRLLIRQIDSGTGSHMESLQQQQQQTTTTGEQAANQAARRTAGFLGTLASIGRSVSRNSSEDSADWQPPPMDEPIFEVHLLEARNVLGGRGVRQAAAPGCQTFGSDGQQAVGSTQAPIFGHQISSAAPESRGRRESLLGTLVAAAQPASRRSSLDGLVVRIFKNQANSNHADGDSRRQKFGLQRATRADSTAGEHTNQFDSLSLHSMLSIGSTTSASNQQPPSQDFIQLPLIRLPNGTGVTERIILGNNLEQTGGNFLGSPNNKLTSAALNPYVFTCRQSEFPLRVSLYQVTKRGGARYTLGHCFVSPIDWFNHHQPQGSIIGNVLAPASGPSETPAEPAGPVTTIPAKTARSGSKVRLTSESGSSCCSSELSSTIADQLTRSRFVLLPANLYNGNNDNNSSNIRDPSIPDTGNGDQQKQAAKFQLIEYRLHQTILEAIK